MQFPVSWSHLLHSVSRDQVLLSEVSVFCWGRMVTPPSHPWKRNDSPDGFSTAVFGCENPRLTCTDHNYTQSQSHVKKGLAVRPRSKSEWAAQTQGFSFPFQQIRNDPEVMSVATPSPAGPLLHLQLQCCRRKRGKISVRKKIISYRNLPNIEN